MLSTVNSPGRLLFVPLDSRPCCSLFVQRLAEFRGLKLCMPPAEWFGNLECRGRSEQLWTWLREQDDGLPALLSADMLLWGGLVGSRRPADLEENQRQSLLKNLNYLGERGNTYAFSTIMRVAPTQKTTGEIQEAELLVKASRLLASHYGDLDILKEAFASNQAQEYLESQGIKLSNQVWRDYLKQRQHKNAANLALISAWKQARDSSYLLFGHDDCQTQGLNLLESSVLQEAARDCGGISFTTGTDELAQLLLARCAAPGQTVSVVWNKEDVCDLVTRYEDCSLGEVMRRQAQVTNTVLDFSDDNEQCEKVLFVWGPWGSVQEESFSQRDAHWPAIPDRFNAFFDKIEDALDAGKSVVLADVAYANGGDCSLVKHLLERKLLTRLSGYAAWNTSGNTLGTALSALLMLPDNVDRNSFLAYKRFLLERVLDDCIYESMVRPQLIRAMGGSFRPLSERETEVLQKRIKEKLWHVYKLYTANMPLHVGVKDISVRLPWRRLFEAEISVEVE